jgi:HSP20 family protein
MLGLAQRNANTALQRDSQRNAARWDPWAEFGSLRQQMDELLDRFVGSSVPLMAGGFTFAPTVDVYETAEELVLLCHLPGMSQEQIQVEATQNGIRISGERRSTLPEGEGITVHRVQGNYGRFQIAYALPVPIQAEQVKATYQNGVLELHLPKVEEAKPKAIPVQIQTQ